MTRPKDDANRAVSVDRKLAMVMDHATLDFTRAVVRSVVNSWRAGDRIVDEVARDLCHTVLDR